MVLQMWTCGWLKLGDSQLKATVGRHFGEAVLTADNAIARLWDTFSLTSVDQLISISWYDFK